MKEIMDFLIVIKKLITNYIPDLNLGTYRLSPGKAYVEGFEVETIVPAFLDFPKPRTVKTLENQSLNYVTGPTFTLNRCFRVSYYRNRNWLYCKFKRFRELVLLQLLLLVKK